MRLWVSHMSGFPEHSGNFFRKAFTALGYKVDFITTPSRAAPFDTESCVDQGYNHAVSVERLLAQFGELPQFFLYIESLGLIPLGLDAAPFSTACYLHDTHTYLPSRLLLAKFFDHVFIAQRDYLDAFRDQGFVSASWLPFACDPEIHRDPGGQRPYDVGFVGSLDNSSERSRLVKTLASQFRMNEQRFYHTDELAAVYGSAKIVVNWPVNADLNLRVFEAMACGALLVTQDVRNGQEELFKNGVHLVTVKTVEEAVEMVRYYLTNDSERRIIAERGRDYVCSQHRWIDRGAEVIEAIADNAASQHKAWIRGCSRREVFRMYGRLFVLWRLVDPVFAVMRWSRREGYGWMHLLPSLLLANLRALNCDLQLLAKLRGALRFR